MNKKIVSGMMLTLLLASMLMLAFDIQQVKAIGTITIMPDGSINPSTPLIQRDGDIYTLTGNINSDSDGIVVQRDNIVVDGVGYCVQGTGTWNGITLSGRSNVTIKNVKVTNFNNGIYLYWSDYNNLTGNTALNNYWGIYLSDSWDNTLSGNNASNNDYGIYLYGSSYNNLTGNTALNNYWGIYLYGSSYNNLTGNTALNNYWGIYLWGDEIFFEELSDYNTLSGNNASNNDYGIYLHGSSYNNLTGNNVSSNDVNGIVLTSSFDNSIFHNNFIDNAGQASNDAPNYWDDGYPSGGNYWSDYSTRYPGAQELDGSGIWDTPYLILGGGRDNYPLMKPYGLPPDIAVTSVSPSKTVVGQGYSADVNVTVNNQGFSTETFKVTAYYCNATITPEQWDTFWSMGDVNRDGYIDSADYDIWFVNSGWTGPPGENPADIDIDGDVDLDDFFIWRSNNGLDIWTYFLIGGVIGNQTVYDLPYGDSTTLTFTWGTTGVPYGNYTVGGYAAPIFRFETDRADNNYGDGKVFVTIPGDTDGDGDVDDSDLSDFSEAYGSEPADPNCDFNKDGVVDALDLFDLSKNYGKTVP